MTALSQFKRSTFLATLPLVAAALAAQRAGAQPATPTVRIGVTPNDGFGEVYYGLDNGIFKNAGITLDVKAFPSDSIIVGALVGGSLDIGVSSPLSLAHAYQNNLSVGYIGAAGVYSSARPTLALVVSKDSPLREAKDLEGKSISVTAIKNATHLAAIAWLARNGADVSKISVVEVPNSNVAPALQRGTIAASVIGEPFLSAAVLTTARVFGKCFDVFGNGALLGGYFTSDEYAKANPAIIHSFTNGLYQTAKWANANHDLSAVILQRVTGMSGDVMRKMTRVVYATSFDPGALQSTLDVAYQQRFIDRPQEASGLVLKV